MPRLVNDAMNWIKDENKARLEAKYGDMPTKAAKALLANISITRVLLMVSSLGLVRWSYSSLSWQTVIDDIDLVGKIGLLIAVVIVGWILSSIGEFFVRYLVYITGFTISLQPGSMIRQYVYNTRVKFSMGVLTFFLNILYLAVIYWGISSLFGFFIPDAEVNWSNWFVVILSLIALAGLVFYPASGVEPQSYPELVKILALFEVVGIIKARDTMRQSVVKIAAEILPAYVAEQLIAKGPSAIDDWMQLPADEIRGVAHALGIGTTQVESIHRLTGDGNQNFYGVKTKDGLTQVAALPANTFDSTNEGS